jgi:hypothetical protein
MFERIRENLRVLLYMQFMHRSLETSLTPVPSRPCIISSGFELSVFEIFLFEALLGCMDVGVILYIMHVLLGLGPSPPPLLPCLVSSLLLSRGWVRDYIKAHSTTRQNGVFKGQYLTKGR